MKENKKDREYAMKTICKRNLKLLKRRDIIKSEKEILKILKHPFIGRFYYSFQTDTKLYLILEYIKGGTLLDFINRKGKLTEEWARLYSAEIILAIEYLHQNSIIYRDLKATNVMLDENNHVKLVDFGLAKIMAGEKASTFCGTLIYAPPEVMSKKSYTTSADWWALVS